MPTPLSLPDTIEQSITLQDKHTFGLSAKASHYGIAKDLDSLTAMIKLAKANDLAIYVLGGGSNTLFMEDWAGMVIDVQLAGIEKVFEDDQAYTIFAAAGVHWHSFVAYCLSQGWYGLENLALIPGRVGASPIQNIGAYGVELDAFVQSVHVLNRETLEVETLSREACQFGYRDSVFKHSAKDQYVIIGVSFCLPKRWKPQTDYGAITEQLGDNEPSPQNIFEAVISIRQSKLPDPKDLGNAGSFFKNALVTSEKAKALKATFPEMPQYDQPDGQTTKIPSGWLIDHLGLKGYRHGNVGVYDKQALVLVNHGSGTQEELTELIDHIQGEVAMTFEIELEVEPMLLGN